MAPRSRGCEGREKDRDVRVRGGRPHGARPAAPAACAALTGAVSACTDDTASSRAHGASESPPSPARSRCDVQAFTFVTTSLLTTTRRPPSASQTPVPEGLRKSLKFANFSFRKKNPEIQNAFNVAQRRDETTAGQGGLEVGRRLLSIASKHDNLI